MCAFVWLPDVFYACAYACAFLCSNVFYVCAWQMMSVVSPQDLGAKRLVFYILYCVYVLYTVVVYNTVCMSYIL